jgi:hypothetical protein
MTAKLGLWLKYNPPNCDGQNIGSIPMAVPHQKKHTMSETTLVLMFDKNDVDKNEIEKLQGATYEDWNEFVNECQHSRTTIYTMKHFAEGVNNGEIDTDGVLIAHVLLKDSNGL